MARKNSDSTAPEGVKPAKVKKVRWYHQVWQAYQMTRRVDPKVTQLILVSVLGILALGVAAYLIWHALMLLLVAIPLSTMVGLAILTRRAETAGFKQIEGQPGAALAALKTIRRGWSFAEEPVAIEARTRDMVFRGVGRPGIVLVSEAPPQRAQRQLEAERKRTARILPNVPITLIQVGDAEGQVPLRKVAGKVRRLKPSLTKPELAQVNARLQAMGGIRLPIPKGVDPTRARPDHKGQR